MQCILCLVIPLTLTTLAYTQSGQEPEKYLQTAETYLSENQPSEAIAFIDSLFTLPSRSDSIAARAYIVKARALERLGQYSQASSMVDTVLSWCHHETHNIPAFIFPEALHRSASIHNNWGKYRTALSMGREGLAWLKKDQSEPSLLNMNMYMVLGSSFYRLYQSDSSMYYKEQALELARRVYGNEHRNVARTLNNLANSYRDLRQYDRALDYLEQVISIEKEAYGENNRWLSVPYYNRGLNLESKGAFREAIENFELSKHLTEINNPRHHYLGADFRKIGDCYFKLHEYGEAKRYYDHALTFLNSLPDIHYELAQVWHSYAKVYEKEEDYAQAISCLDSAIRIANLELGKDHPWVATYWSDRAYYCVHLNDFQTGNSNARTALKILGYEQDFDPVTSIAKNIYYYALAIAGYAAWQEYQIADDSSLLHKALIYYEQSIAIIQQLRQGMHNENSRHQLSSETIEVYEHAVQVCYALYEKTGHIKYAEHALRISEKSKISTVLEALLGQQVQGFPNLPDNVAWRENDLHQHMNDLSEKMHQTRHAKVNMDSLIQPMKDSLFGLRQELYSFLDTLKRFYPRYHHHKYAANNLDIKKLQSQLNSGQVALEFFDADSLIFLFTVTSDHIHVRRLIRGDSLENTIHKFITHLSNRDSVLADPQTSIHTLAACGYSLYKNLIDDSLTLSGKSLLIIPDQFESRLIFDVFLTNNPESGDPATWPYLFRDYPIHYGQSLWTWSEQLRRDGYAPNLFAGFSPTYHTDITSMSDEHTPRSQAAPLQGAAEEIREIEKIMGGSIYSDSTACESHFVNEAGAFRILHISAHAFVNDSMPGSSHFLFSNCSRPMQDNLLTAEEICRLQLNADLAVLSACHTGFGPLRRGEGIMSLGRAFSFAGVPSTLLGMWKLPDQSTSRMLPSFYKYLKQGQDIHKSLNLARLEYLEKTRFIEEKHPYFWSGIILYGKSNAVKLPSFSSLAIWIILFVAIAASFYILWMYNQKNRSQAI